MAGPVGKKVVIVEDEMIISLDLCFMLATAGHTIASAFCDAESALDWFAANTADAVIMDVRLSGPMSGVEAGRRLKARYGLPVIIITGLSPVREPALTEGFDAVLVKPVSCEKLLSVLASLPAPSLPTASV